MGKWETLKENRKRKMGDTGEIEKLGKMRERRRKCVRGKWRKKEKVGEK